LTERRRDRLERVGESLPALHEYSAHHSLEHWLPSDIDSRRPEAESDDGGVHLGRRSKGARRKVQDAFDVGHQLNLDRHSAIVGLAWSRQQPVGNLALQHQAGIGEHGSLPGFIEQSKKNRRRDVVWKVADDPDRPSLGLNQVLDVDVQEIALDKTHIWWTPPFECREEVTIDFDCDDSACPFCKRPSQRTSAWANLEEGVFGTRSHRRNQSGNPCWLEEMLTEPFARARELSTVGFRIPSP